MQINSIHLKTAASAFALMAAIAPSLCMAQEQDSTDSGGLAPIVVTANRQASLAQETPVAVATVSGTAMKELGITRMEDFMHMTPGLTMGGANSRNGMSIQMRGSTTATDPGGVDESVVMFLDGMYLGRGGMTNMNLSDVERVEVLRGPQGTLWGRNVVGGAINVITKEPGEEMEADAQIMVGNYKSFSANGRVSGPLVDNRLFGSVTFYADQSDGWLKNDTTGNSLYGTDQWGVRGKLRYVSDAGNEIKLALTYNRDTSRGIGRNLIIADPTPLFQIPTDLFHHTVLPTDGVYDNTAFGASLTTEWHLGDAYTLTTLTGYFNNKNGVKDQSWTYGYADIGGSRQKRVAGNDKTFSQEIRLANDPGSRFSWQVGGIYFHNKGYNLENWLLSADPGTRANIWLGITSSDYFMTIAPTTDSFAVFGQGTFAFNDVLHLTIGGRYTTDKKKVIIDNWGDYSAFHLDGPFRVALNNRFNGFTPKVTLDALFKNVGMFDSILAYATYARGWKSGGYLNGRNAEEASAIFLPETADNYEAGLKTTLFGNKATLNATLFHTEYKHLQMLVVDVSQMGTVSADSHITGLEIESAVKLNRYLNATFAYSWYDGAFNKGTIIAGEDVSGRPLTRVAPHSFSIGLTGDFPVADETKVGFRVNYAYQSPTASTTSAALDNAYPQLRSLTKSSMLDGRIALTRKNWEFSLWGRNILNDKVLIYTNDYHELFMYTPTDGNRSVMGMYRTPRTYGIAVRWTY